VHRTGTLIALVLLAGCPSSHSYSDGRGIEGQLEREIEALTIQKQMLEEQVKTCSEGTPSDLYPELKQILVSPEVTVANRGTITMVTLPDSHVFGADDISIRVEASVTLDLLAASLKAHKDVTVVIEGNTADAIPTGLSKSYSSLRELSYARAKAVHDVLVDKFKVPDEQITLSARGPYAPIASNDTPAGQARNRRVVIFIYPAGAR
jgi:outer membrane protein OmpA-like peptidoglycan-associated protein